jgi:hypothetical protein
MACSIVQLQSVQCAQLQKPFWQRERVVSGGVQCVEFGRNSAESDELLLSRLTPVLQRKKRSVVALSPFCIFFSVAVFEMVAIWLHSRKTVFWREKQFSH